MLSKNCAKPGFHSLFGENTLVKPSLIFGKKPPKKVSLANCTVLKTRHRHIPRSAQRKQAEVKGLGVFTLCRLERQARGTKRGTKVGVLCSLCSHVSLVGLSLRNCIRWRLDSRARTQQLQTSERTFCGCRLARNPRFQASHVLEKLQAPSFAVRCGFQAILGVRESRASSLHTWNLWPHGNETKADIEATSLMFAYTQSAQVSPHGSEAKAAPCRKIPCSQPAKAEPLLCGCKAQASPL